MATKNSKKKTEKKVVKLAKPVKSTAKTKAVKPKAAAPKVVPKAVAPKVVAPKAAAPKVAEKLKIVKQDAKPASNEYKVGNYVVYPTHGVGKITALEVQNIGNVELKVFVIAFEKDKMILRVPVHRAAAAGLRNVSNADDIQKALQTLRGRARTSRGMWSRRAQEYEAKINSGSIIFIAEVVRDLHKNVDQAERSYSERMIYEAAFNRLAREVAASELLDTQAATDRLLTVLKAQVKAMPKREAA